MCDRYAEKQKTQNKNKQTEIRTEGGKYFFTALYILHFYDMVASAICSAHLAGFKTRKWMCGADGPCHLTLEMPKSVGQSEDSVGTAPDGQTSSSEKRLHCNRAAPEKSKGKVTTRGQAGLK